MDAVQVGPQYISTRHAITVRGIYNPACNSYTFGPNTNWPLPAAGFVAPVTATAVRNTLLQPRGTLVLEAAGFAMIISPPGTPSSQFFEDRQPTAPPRAPGGLEPGAGLTAPGTGPPGFAASAAVIGAGRVAGG